MMKNKCPSKSQLAWFFIRFKNTKIYRPYKTGIELNRTLRPIASWKYEYSISQRHRFQYKSFWYLRITITKSNIYLKTSLFHLLCSFEWCLLQSYLIQVLILFFIISVKYLQPSDQIFQHLWLSHHKFNLRSIFLFTIFLFFRFFVLNWML